MFFESNKKVPDMDDLDATMVFWRGKTAFCMDKTAFFLFLVGKRLGEVKIERPFQSPSGGIHCTKYVFCSITKNHCIYAPFTAEYPHNLGVYSILGQLRILLRDIFRLNVGS